MKPSHEAINAGVRLLPDLQVGTTIADYRAVEAILRAAYEVELGKTFVPLADAAAWVFLHTSHEVFEAFEDRFGRYGDEDES